VEGLQGPHRRRARQEEGAHPRRAHRAARRQKQRSALFEAFRSSTGTPNSVMFATDVMARGVDVADIDWVVQFDPPRQST